MIAAPFSVPLTVFLSAIVFASAAALPVQAAEDEATLPPDVVAHRDLIYAARATGPVKLDLFTPPGDGPFPVVLWIHGGAWKMGDKAAWPHMNFALRDGFAVANVEYRFSQVAAFPAQLDDVTAALDFLTAHAAEYKLDPTRIAATGESAGGHLAALLGMTHSSAAMQPNGAGNIRCVIDLFGPADLRSLAERGPQLAQDLDQLLGVQTITHPDLAKAASPIDHVSKDEPPFLIFHGTKDPLVPFEQSQQLADAIKAAGATVELVPVPDAGHAGPPFWTAPMQAKMIAFLKKYLAPQ